MQRNFILTDVMKTGYHMELEQFIAMHSMEDQTFDYTGQYYDLHQIDLNKYDRKFAIIDYRHFNHSLDQNQLFREELRKRCDRLKTQGFVFIKATPWESLDNVINDTLHPQIEIDHVKWTGGVSWFWFYMYNKHKNNKFKFTHDHNGSYWHKKHDFLYLNKTFRVHRAKLYDRLLEQGVLENSLYTFHEHKSRRVLTAKYELPWAQNYPYRGMDQDIYEPPYNDTVCSLVSETNDNDYEVFMTEKIWKPIIAKHIFVVHGNHLYLKELKDMGFKTFGDHFDETYDNEKDAGKRIDKLVTLCKNLKSKCSEGGVVASGNKEWQDIYDKTQSIRTHNYNTFFDESKLKVQINKTLKLFLEFADSSQVSSRES